MFLEGADKLLTNKGGKRMNDIKSYVEDPELKKKLQESMRGELKYSLLNDFLAKYAMQNDLYALQGLLAALLRVRQEEITDIQVLNPIEPAEAVNDKTCILDLKLELNHKIINIEIQNTYQEFWPERSLTYLCRVFDHLQSGEGYEKIRPCIHIGIMSTDLFAKEDPRYTGEFYSEYELLNIRTGTGYTGKFGIRVVSLNHLEDADEIDKKTANGLYYWAKLFKARTWEELRSIAEENPSMESYIGTVRKLTAEEKVLQACEARRRYNTEMATYNGLLANVQQKLEKKEEELAVKEEALGIAEERLDSTEKKLDSTEKKLDSAQKELDSKNQQIDDLLQEIARLQAKR